MVYETYVAIAAFAFICAPVLTFITPSKLIEGAHRRWLLLLMRNYWLSLIGLSLCSWQLLSWVFPYPSGQRYWYSLAAGLVVGILAGIMLIREYILCLRTPEPSESETEIV